MTRAQHTPTANGAHWTAKYKFDYLMAKLTAHRAQNFGAPDDGSLTHWGHVGSLNHVNELLAEVDRFLGGAS